MEKLLKPTVLRAVFLTLLGAAGTLFAIAWPLGHKTFCSGISGLVL